MRTQEQTRCLEVKQGEDWVPAAMGQIDEGDVFRMFNPDGTAVVDQAGKTEWTVTAMPAIPCE